MKDKKHYFADENYSSLVSLGLVQEGEQEKIVYHKDMWNEKVCVVVFSIRIHESALTNLTFKGLLTSRNGLLFQKIERGLVDYNHSAP